MRYLASGLVTLLTLSLTLSHPVHAVDPYVDTGFTPTTPLPDTDLIVVREEFIGASGVELSSYGIGGGPHAYVQSVYFRLFVDKNSSNTDSYAGLVVFPNSVTILGIITEGLDLGGSNDDSLFTESDSLFGIGTDADRYSESDRGFETSGTGSAEYIGIIDNSSFAFALNVGSGVDDFRVIIDYGDSFPAGLSFDVLGIDVTPPGNAAPVVGIRVGNDTVPSVFGSGDYGETLSLQNIPLTSTIAPTPSAVLPFEPEVSLFLARDPIGNTYVDSYDTELQVPLPGQFLIESNVPNPRGITDHENGLIYCVGRDGGFAVIDPMVRTVATTLLANLPGNVIDVTNVPGHTELFVVRNPSTPTEIDVLNPAGPNVSSTFTIEAPNTPVAIVNGSDGLLYILGKTGELTSVGTTGANDSTVELSPPTGIYDGMTSRTGTDLLYLLRNTSGDTKIDVYDIGTQLAIYDFATLPSPTAPADISDGPQGLLYVIGTGSGAPAGYTVVDPVSGAVLYSNELLDFSGVYRSITALLPQYPVDAVTAIPSASLRHLAWPNPFNPRVQINYELPRAASTRLRILDVRGRLVRTLHQGWEPVGWQSHSWDGRDEQGRTLASGSYFYQITSAGLEASGKLVMVQ